jgi:hypothetical protein
MKFSDQVEKFLDGLARRHQLEVGSADNDQRRTKLEYSIALAAVFITFGFWFFDFIKTQNYFLFNPLDSWIILALVILSAFSVTSGIMLLF